MHDHGQSWDWVIDGDPSGMIGLCARATARNAEPDPIFPAIARWKEALAFLNGEFDNEIAEQAALDKEHEAMKAVLRVVPTTLQGIRAKIDLVVNTDFESSHLVNHLRHACTDEPLNAFLETLYDGARLTAGEA